jgi:hypothetical protein
MASAARNNAKVMSSEAAGRVIATGS